MALENLLRACLNSSKDGQSRGTHEIAVETVAERYPALETHPFVHNDVLYVDYLSRVAPFSISSRMISSSVLSDTGSFFFRSAGTVSSIFFVPAVPVFDFESNLNLIRRRREFPHVRLRHHEIIFHTYGPQTGKNKLRFEP